MKELLSRCPEKLHCPVPLETLTHTPPPVHDCPKKTPVQVELRKYLAAAGRENSLALSISKLVFLASATLISISAAVFLVCSRFSTNAESDKILSPADDSLISKSSSRDFKRILYSFCCRVNSAFCSSRSGLSALTTSASN